MSNADRLAVIAAALVAEGYTCKLWKGERLYVSLRGRQLGYVTAEDDGTTGTCRNVQRSGDISATIRAALAT